MAPSGGSPSLVLTLAWYGCLERRPALVLFSSPDLGLKGQGSPPIARDALRLLEALGPMQKWPLRFDIFELLENKLPVRLINTTNERRLVQGHETPLRMKGYIYDVSSELASGD
ncbi:hypothetical protein TNCV_1626871 [Trichonephila clavipes]|nr:hypothetical protein TNCV_1626871 [Trichonephila clavipes]